MRTFMPPHFCGVIVFDKNKKKTYIIIFFVEILSVKILVRCNFLKTLL